MDGVGFDDEEVVAGRVEERVGGSGEDLLGGREEGYLAVFPNVEATGEVKHFAGGVILVKELLARTAGEERLGATPEPFGLEGRLARFRGRV